jgi:hypothetical protein
VFTAPLHSNGSYSIVACVFVDAGMCLSSRCLAMNVYSDFTIPAFGRHSQYNRYSRIGTGLLDHDTILTISKIPLEPKANEENSGQIQIIYLGSNT